MTGFSDRILDAIELALEEREEIEARRAAEARKLCIECRGIEPAAWPQRLHADEYDLHLIEPRHWRCIAIRRSWAQMHRLVEDMRPAVLRRFIEQAEPCALHPPSTDPGSEDEKP